MVLYIFGGIKVKVIVERSHPDSIVNRSLNLIRHGYTSGNEYADEGEQDDKDVVEGGED